jgi:DNA repair exonuclease SbcCD ATPase subunit
LHNGFVGIIGHNGDGKSNALNAAYAALSGDFSRHSQGKPGHVCQLAGADEPSSIEVFAEHGGTEFSIYRSLTQGKQSLTMGGLTYTKAAEIKQMLEEVLGITPQLLDAYVFVAQWRFFAFIDTPAERAKQFAQLCQTTRAEKLWQLLGSQVDLDRSLADQVLDNSTELMQSVESYRQQLETTEQELAQVRLRVLSKKVVAAHEKVIATAAEAGRVRERLPGMEQRIAELLTVAKKAVADWKTAVAELEASSAAFTELATAANTAREQLAAKTAYDRARAVFDRVRASLAALAEPKPPAACSEPPVEELDGQIATLFAESEKLSELLESCADSPTCPTCGTPTDSKELKARLKAATARLPLAQEERRQLQSRKQARKAYDQKAYEYGVALQHYTKQKADLARQLEGDATEPPPPVDVTECTAAIKRHTEADAAQHRLQRSVNTLVATKEAAKAKHQAAKAALEDARTLLESLTVSDEDLRAAEEALEDHSAADRELAALEQRQAAHRDLIDTFERQLEILFARKERSAKARHWVEMLEQARAVLHRNALPALVHQTALEDLTGRINEALERFNSKFYVTATEDLDMLAHFQNGVVSRVADLSGGQKMVFALTFRLAVNSTFAGQIGMMVLDEPTACVDEQNIERMVDVFAALGQEAKDKGHQIVVVTHEELLHSVFDQVLRVPEAL